MKTLDSIFKEKIENNTFDKKDSIYLLNRLLKKSYLLFLASSLLICIAIFYFDKIRKLAYISANSFLNSIVIFRPDIWYLGWTLMFFCFTMFVLIYTYFKKKQLKKSILFDYVKLYKDFKIIDLINFILTIVMSLNFLFTFLITPASVNGESMEPTLYNNDRILFQSLILNPKKDDIVIAKSDKLEHFIIKRVCAIPGDKIEFKSEALYVNDRYVLIIDFTEWKTISGTSEYTSVVPNNNYILIGDNRQNSIDSRKLGYFTRDELIGTYFFRFFPFNRIGF